MLGHSWIPNRLVDDLEKIFRSSLWGKGSDRRGIHLIAWENLSFGIDQGGLALRRLREFRQAMLGKQFLKKVKQEESLWAMVVRRKEKIKEPEDLRRKRSTASALWKGMCLSADLVLDGLRYQLGNGEDVRALVDPWLKGVGEKANRI
jgi:hypothetical protein